MQSTFLLHKPVIYGSAFANSFFLMLLFSHIVAAAIAPVSAIAAFVVRKGAKSHRRIGNLFAGSMVVIALTGIILDVIRLCFFVEDNHTKYAGYGMPSTYPARLGFLFVGVCVLYILREVVPLRISSKQPTGTNSTVIPSLLVGSGLSLTAIVTFHLNPWTGALWMIWTFILIIIVLFRTPVPSQNSRELATSRHRFGTSCLAAFSWWGAMQSFGPAIALWLTGPDLSTSPYVGDRPGPFSLTFIFFFIGWMPFCLLAGYLIYHFAVRRRKAARG